VTGATAGGGGVEGGEVASANVPLTEFNAQKLLGVLKPKSECQHYQSLL